MEVIGVAATNNNGIGMNGKIPFHSPLDMALFRNLTKIGKKPAVVFGRLTFNSMNNKPLVGRTNILISSVYNGPKDNLHVVPSVKEAYRLAKSIDVDNLYVIGGKRVYHEFLNYYNKFYVSYFNSDEECDVNIFSTIAQLHSLFITQTVEFPDMRLVTYGDQYRDPDTPHITTILEVIIQSPSKRDPRTNTMVKSGYNVTHSYDLFDSGNYILPATTLRRQALKSIFYETMWFIKGRTDLKYLHDNGVHVWDANYEDKMGEPATTPGASVGKTYGYYWRNFNGVDQLGQILDSLRNKNYHRRMVLSQWDPSNIEECVLPSCVMSYTFTVDTSIPDHPRLNLLVNQRSSDIVTAMNWNVCSAAYLVHLICSTVGNLYPNNLTFVVADAHIYENQLDAAREILSRQERAPPLIEINRQDNIEDYTWKDIGIFGYHHQGNINIGEMQV